MESEGYCDISTDGRYWRSRLRVSGRLHHIFEHTSPMGERTIQYITPENIKTIHIDLGFPTREEIPKRPADVLQKDTDGTVIRQIWYEGNTVVCDSGISRAGCRKWIARYESDPTIYEVHEMIDRDGQRTITWYEANQFGLTTGVLAEYRRRGPSTIVIKLDGEVIPE